MAWTPVSGADAIDTCRIVTPLSASLSTGTRVYYEFYNYGPNNTAMEPFPYDFMMGMSETLNAAFRLKLRHIVVTVGGSPARKSRDPDSVEDASMVYYCEQGRLEISA